MKSKLKFALFAVLVLAALAGVYFFGRHLLPGQAPSLTDPNLASKDFNVTFTFGWEGCYRPGRWVPVDFNIQVTKLKEPFDGKLTFVAQQDSLTDMSIEQDFVLTPGQARSLTIAAKVKFAADSCQASIYDKQGRTRWDSQYALYSQSNVSGDVKAVQVDEMLIGLCKGRDSSLGSLRRNSSTGTQPGRSSVYVAERRTWQLPWDWAGYDCLDLLVLHDVDCSALKDPQIQAITRWVRGGGKLLIVMGTRPLPAASPLARLLPAVPGAPQTVPIPHDRQQEWGLAPAADATVQCWDLRELAARGFEPVMVDASLPYFVRGSAGFGQVGVLAFDATPLFAQPEQAAVFWTQVVKQLDSRINYAQGHVAEPDNNMDYSFRNYALGPAVSHSDAVVGHLLAIPEMRPLSIWWVISLLAALAILLGPVDYLVLKKLDRLPLTWVTSSLCIVLFSVGAYYGVQKIRGGDLQVRMVSSLDGIAGQPQSTWLTSYAGIFAPDSDSYRLAGLGRDQWWSAISPSRGGDYEYSYGRDESASRHIYCVQRDGANTPSALPINIWSMQCLLVQTPLDGSQGAADEAKGKPKPQFPISAGVQCPDDPNQEAVVEITNHADVPFVEANVRIVSPASQRGMMLEVGTVEPGQTLSFRGKFEFGRWEPGSERIGLEGSDQIVLAQGVRERSNGIVRHLRSGEAVVCGKFLKAPVGFTVQGRSSHFDHVQLVRLVVPRNGLATETQRTQR